MIVGSATILLIATCVEWYIVLGRTSPLIVIGVQDLSLPQGKNQAVHIVGNLVLLLAPDFQKALASEAYKVLVCDENDAEYHENERHYHQRPENWLKTRFISAET